MPPDIPNPWGAFLRDLDRELEVPVELHCLGGFVMTMLYGLLRPTADVDVLGVRPRLDLNPVAGIGSPLHKKHRVYLQLVTVLEAYPEDYEERLTEMFPGAFKNLRLLALDPYDLALTKLRRNSQRDREDVLHLAGGVPLDVQVLRARYEAMRPCLGSPEREDLTLKLWIELIEEKAVNPRGRA
jgi:Nucleotidyltransferase of unknown function (DUF6036)